MARSLGARIIEGLEDAVATAIESSEGGVEKQTRELTVKRTEQARAFQHPLAGSGHAALAGVASGPSEQDAPKL